MDPVSTFSWVFEYQTIETEILTQFIRYRRAEINLLVDEKVRHGSWQGYTSKNVHLLLRQETKQE